MTLQYQVLKLTNKATGKFFIYARRFDPYNEPDLPSNHKLQADIDKYGKDGFERTLIQMTDSLDEAQAVKFKILDAYVTDRHLCYNVIMSGDPKKKRVRAQGSVADARRKKLEENKLRRIETERLLAIARRDLEASR